MVDETETQETQLVQEQAQAALKPENVRQMKIAMVTLATCVVEAINESDNQFEQRFVKLLDKAYHNYRDNSDADPQHVLEVIHWTREMLQGWNPVPGRKESIFGDGQGESEAAAE
ncbi:MAG: hypothetical protein H0W39_10970 [Sphingomonas sp.]|nr:hypothetical protein [Sphingomonas sp.]